MAARREGHACELLARGVPTLGVCLGAQLVSEAAGGSPRRAPEPEIGWVEVELTPEGRADPLLGALPERFEAFEWHSYEAGPPEGAVTLATSPVCIQAYRLTGARAWGIQFHAEVTRPDVDAWSTPTTATRTRCASGSTPRR